MSSRTAPDFDEAYDIEEPKRVRLSLHLIIKRHLPPDAAGWPQNKVVDALDKVTHLRLDREHIGHIDGLELLGPQLTNIYLQHNKIQEIENLECVSGIKFMTLASNLIQEIQGLSHLHSLLFLDLSDNRISNFDIDELPQSLVILNLKDNPCALLPDHRGRIIQDMQRLKQLDEEEVSREERIEAGYVVSSEEEEEEDEEEEDDDDKEEEDNLHSIQDMVQIETSRILLRSQDRMEQRLAEHHVRLQQLHDIRQTSQVPGVGDLQPRIPTPRTPAAAAQTQSPTQRASHKPTGSSSPHNSWAT